MTHTYTEDQLVEQPTIRLFEELNWHTISAQDEILGAQGTFGRETTAEVVIMSRLRATIAMLNPSLPPEAITSAVDELVIDRSMMSLVAANRELSGQVELGAGTVVS